jgi:hypothetical protein
MSLLLLGPSAWLRGYRPRVPGWVTEVLPPGSPAAETSIPTAKEIRFGFVARLRLANIPVTMLELRPDRAGEMVGRLDVRARDPNITRERFREGWFG